MKILVIDEEFPYPPNFGKRIRTFNLIKRLSEKHTISYLAYGTEQSDSFKKFEAMGLNPVAVNHQIQDKAGITFYIKLLLNLFSKLPYTVQSHYSDIFQQAPLMPHRS